MWQIGHTAGQSRPLRNRVAVASQLPGWDVGMGVVGHVRFLSEHFWIDGGDALAQQRRGPCPSRDLSVDPSFFFASLRSICFVRVIEPRISCGDARAND
jgi:hypothetical protein